MSDNYKDIHIGSVIQKAVVESEIEIGRICNFINCDEQRINKMYESKILDTEILLKWSKLLEYDFFRLYSQHLILYASIAADKPKDSIKKQTSLQQFRKNIYTKEIIEFILEQLETKQMTKIEIMDRYRIPKTTLYKWISKYTK